MGVFNTAMISIVIFAVTCDMGDCQRRRARTNPLGPLLQSLLGGNQGTCLNEDAVLPTNLLASILQNPQLRSNLNLVAQPRLRQAQPYLEAVNPCVDVPQRVIVNPGCAGPKINVPCQNVNVPLQTINVPCQNVPAPVRNIVIPASNFVVPTPNIQVPCMEQPCACTYTGIAPQALVNPFLPAASPVSAIAPPTSNLLPPANLNQCRCNFLRKIPIPPPCL